MLPKQAEVVVVGAGVLGCSAAFHLAQAGLRGVVLLDSGAVANGTTPFAPGQTGHLSEVTELPGVVVATACGVGGISLSPGIGRAVADLVTGQPYALSFEALNAARFGVDFDDDALLRGSCEEVYSRMYLGEI